MDTLPAELLVHIFSYCDSNTIKACSQVCLAWHKVAEDDRVWEQHYKLQIRMWHLFSANRKNLYRAITWKKLYLISRHWDALWKMPNMVLEAWKEHMLTHWWPEVQRMGKEGIREFVFRWERCHCCGYPEASSFLVSLLSAVLGVEDWLLEILEDQVSHLKGDLQGIHALGTTRLVSTMWNVLPSHIKKKLFDQYLHLELQPLQSPDGLAMLVVQGWQMFPFPRVALEYTANLKCNNVITNEMRSSLILRSYSTFCFFIVNMDQQNAHFECEVKIWQKEKDPELQWTLTKNLQVNSTVYM